MPTPAEPLLYYTGLTLCGFAAWRAGSGAIGWARDRRAIRRAADRDAVDFRVEVEAAATAARARLATLPAWEGARPLRVSAIVDESPTVKSFYLTDPQGRPLPDFLPGQHLTVALPTAPGGPATIRCYSLSDRPRAEYYRLTVKRQEPPRDAPETAPGIGSGWLHDRVEVGDAIDCHAPRGVFFYNPLEPRPAVFIGAGVGVTPLVSMLAAARHAGTLAPTHAFLSFTDGTSLLFRDTLNELRREDTPESSVRVALTRPAADDQLGVDYDLRGRVTIETLRRELPSSNFDFYVCGPPSMMQSLVPDLLEWGVPAEAIHYEAFGPASVSSPGSVAIQDRAVGSPVRFDADEEAVVWDGAYQTLLELAEARGVPIGSGCRAGNCGACRVRIVEGAVATLKRPGMAVADGECLACISLPDGPVLLES